MEYTAFLLHQFVSIIRPYIRPSSTTSPENVFLLQFHGKNNPPPPPPRSLKKKLFFFLYFLFGFDIIPPELTWFLVNDNHSPFVFASPSDQWK